MARIRTIKPEFWGHPVMAKLPDHIQLLAIALINFADDEGYFLADPALVRSFARPFDEDSSNVTGSLQELSRIGYIETFGSAVHGQIGRIVSFKEHQVISHPKASKFKGYASSIVPVIVQYDSIGKGMEGKGLNGKPKPSANDKPCSQGLGGMMALKEEGKKLNLLIWEKYSSAYFNRYKTEPVRNAKVNANVSDLGKRLGKEAPLIAQFYLDHHDSWYVKNLHPVSLLLRDAEKLHTEWATNRKMTGTIANQVEKRIERSDVFATLLEEPN